MKDLLIDYVSYNLWANAKLLKYCEDHVDEKVMNLEMKSSFSTIRKTFLHIWDAEHIWKTRLEGKQFSVLPSQQEGILLRDHLIHSKEFANFTKAATDEFILGSTSYKNMSGDLFTSPNYKIIMHCMNHSTFHRGQIVNMLRNADVDKDLPQTDYIAWVRRSE